MKLCSCSFLLRAYITFPGFGLLQEGGNLVKFDGQPGRRSDVTRKEHSDREARKFIPSYCRRPLDILCPLLLLPSSLPFIFRFILTTFGPHPWPLYVIYQGNSRYLCSLVYKAAFSSFRDRELEKLITHRKLLHFLFHFPSLILKIVQQLFFNSSFHRWGEIFHSSVK